MKKLFAVFFLFPNFLFAQKTDTAKSLPIVEITSTRLGIFAVGQQQLAFDSIDLRTFENRNLSDLIQNLTPLSIRAYGVGLANVASRGLASRHTALIWNGLNIQNSLTGAADLSVVEVGSVEKASVKFGGSSALFGGGAMGGAIFLDNALDNSTKKISGNVGLNNGSFGLFGQNIKLKMGNENVAAQLRISHQKALNNFEFRDNSAFGKPIKKAGNAAFDKLNLTNSLYFNLGKNRFLKINNWLTNINRQIPPTMTSRVDSARQIEYIFRSVAEFSGPLSINSVSNVFKARIGYFNEQLNYNSDVVSNSENNIRTFIAETETVFNRNEKQSLRLGFNYTNNKTFGNNLGDINHERNRFALFASQIIELNKTKFSANIRQEVVDNQLVPFVFSIGFERAISNKPLVTSLRGSFSRNYNLPALNDLYWNKLGNPNLKAENGFSGELGFDVLKNNANYNTKLGITLFALQTNNWIQWSPKEGSSWTPSNLKKVLSRGVELTFKNQLQLNNKIVLKTHFNYQLSRATEIGDSLNLQLLYTPIHAGSAGIGLIYKDLYFNYYQNASDRRRMAGDFTNPFTLANATIGYAFKINKYQLNTALQIANIWNADYEVIRFYAQPRRSFEVQLNLSF